jgi:hypothetical protein
MATSSSIQSMRERCPGKSDTDAARLYALRYGYAAIIRYKSTPEANGFTTIACCPHEDQVAEVFKSPYCHNAERIYDSRNDPEFSGCWGDRRDHEVITLSEVTTSSHPILFVVHRGYTKNWIVTDRPWGKIKDPIEFSKEQIIRIDPTIEEVTDLPIGWIAHRTSKDAPWQRVLETAFEQASNASVGNSCQAVPLAQTTVPTPQLQLASETSSVSGCALELCPQCEARVMFISNVCPNCQKDRHEPVLPKPISTSTSKAPKSWWEFWR